MHIRLLPGVLLLCLLLQAGCVRQMSEGFMAGTDTVSIKTVPAGVRVYKDGTYMCNSPCFLPLEYSGVSGERYTVTLEKDGYKTQSFEMNRDRLTDKFWSGDYITGSRFGAGNTFVFTYALDRDPAAPVQTAQSPQPVIQQLASAPQTQGGQERRVALVIGNGSYSASPLKNPVNDARAISSTLQALGFEVILVTNGRLREMEAAVDEFSAKAQGATALFFFAGHGMQVDGENYLLPIGADINDEGDVRYETLPAGRVLSNLHYAQSKLNIVILDACRNNPFARFFRSAPRGLAQLTAPRGSIVAFSTAPGDVAADGAGSNSPYAKAFVRHAQTPGVTVEKFFKEVAKDVAAQTDGEQRPWVSSDFLGEFYFKQ